MSNKYFINFVPKNGAITVYYNLPPDIVDYVFDKFDIPGYMQSTNIFEKISLTCWVDDNINLI